MFTFATLKQVSCIATRLKYDAKINKNIDTAIKRLRKFNKLKIINIKSIAMNGKRLKEILAKYKVILPKKRRYYIETLWQHYEHNHHIIELETAMKVIDEKYPEYSDACKKALSRTSGYMFNMMIMKKELVDDYCSWLFPILFEMSEKLETYAADNGLSAFENRFPGRVSERLFNVWLQYQIDKGVIKKNEIKDLPFMYMENINIFNKGVTFLKAKFLKKKPQKSF